jgi:uncharacterized membrane protein YhfC
MSLGLGLLIVAGALAVAVGWTVDRAVAGGGVVWPRLMAGAGAFLVASIAQNLLVTPVALLIHGAGGLQPLIPASAAEAIYYGIAAGVAQEVAKLGAIQLYVRRASVVPAAVAVGTGFALLEIFLVSIPAFRVVSSGLGNLPVAVWERFSATLFHVGTCLIIGAGLLKGRPWIPLLAVIVLHSIPDSAVGLMSYLDVHPILVFESLNFVFSAALLAAGIVLIRRAAAGTPQGSGATP